MSTEETPKHGQPQSHFCALMNRAQVNILNRLADTAEAEEASAFADALHILEDVRIRRENQPPL